MKPGPGRESIRRRYFPPADAGIWTAGALPAVEKRTLHLPGLGGARLRAVFAADFHLRRGTDPSDTAGLLAGLGADIVLLGGDFSDRREDALRLIDALKAVKAPLGVFAVAGNNDSEAFPKPGTLSRALERAGIRLLRNESVDAGPLHLGGLDDCLYGRPDASGMFRGCRRCRVLLSHYPILPEVPVEDMPDLMLAGHTHGGQFNLAGLNPYAVGFESFGRRRATHPAAVSGLHVFGRTQLLISKGIGTSRIPLRVGVRPEIHLLTLEENDKG